MVVKHIYKKVVPEKTRNTIRTKMIQSKARKYQGERFRCNVCDSHFSEFLPYGLIPRENALCPGCLSLERTRVLWLYIKNEILQNLDKKIRMLHFAPEAGLYHHLKKNKNIEYINGDINKALADEVIDITNIQYPSQHFNFIICSHVLGHVNDERTAIQELYRVLKPGGTALVMTLVDKRIPRTYENPYLENNQERQALYGEPDLVRLHGADFSRRLRKGGFEVDAIDYASQLGESARSYYSLGNGDREIIYKCTKSNNSI